MFGPFTITSLTLGSSSRGCTIRQVAWAERTGALIVEDDYDAEFRYDREPVGALQGIAPDRVFTLGTVSKSLAPAIRLGWVLAPPALAALFGSSWHLGVDVAIVIRSLPTIAAEPSLTGLHAVTTRPAPRATADTLISLRSTAKSLLTLLLQAGRRVPTG